MRRKFWPLFLVLLLLSATVGLLFLALRRRTPASAIRQALQGYPERVIRNWTAISAHETAGWTSRVFQDANNLFGMLLPRGTTTAVGELPYGEHQAIFRSVEDSAKDIRLYMEQRFRYPMDFASLADQVAYMKSKGYFVDSVSNYLAGAQSWYQKLYGTTTA